MGVHARARDRAEESRVRDDAHALLELHQGIEGKDAEEACGAMDLQLCCSRSFVLLDEVVLQCIHFSSRIVELEIRGEEIRGGA